MLHILSINDLIGYITEEKVKKIKKKEHKRKYRELYSRPIL